MNSPIVYVPDPSESAGSVVGLCAAGYYAVLLLGCGTDAAAFGRRCCDFQDGTLLFFAPQSAGIFASVAASCPIERMVAFDPVRFGCTSLGCVVGDYPFFGYYPAEMLHLSASERRTVCCCLEDIRREACLQEDSFSCRVLAHRIGLLLDHCIRFYERQFITRSLFNESLLLRYDRLVIQWIESGKLRTEGFPSESFCAGNLELSSAYFRSLLHFETGNSHAEYMQAKRIETAGRLLSAGDQPVDEIASLLGFASAVCFSRFFKKVTGFRPEEYRCLN